MIQFLELRATKYTYLAHLLIFTFEFPVDCFALRELCFGGRQLDCQGASYVTSWAAGFTPCPCGRHRHVTLPGLTASACAGRVDEAAQRVDFDQALVIHLVHHIPLLTIGLHATQSPVGYEVIR